jgi:hypothetical protein
MLRARDRTLPEQILSLVQSQSFIHPFISIYRWASAPRKASSTLARHAPPPPTNICHAIGRGRRRATKKRRGSRGKRGERGGGGGEAWRQKKRGHVACELDLNKKNRAGGRIRFHLYDGICAQYFDGQTERTIERKVSVAQDERERDAPRAGARPAIESRPRERGRERGEWGGVQGASYLTKPRPGTSTGGKTVS